MRQATEALQPRSPFDELFGALRAGREADPASDFPAVELYRDGARVSVGADGEAALSLRGGEVLARYVPEGVRLATAPLIAAVPNVELYERASASERFELGGCWSADFVANFQPLMTEEVLGEQAERDRLVVWLRRLLATGA